MKWSNLKGQQWGGATLPVHHDGEFFNIELKVITFVYYDYFILDKKFDLYVHVKIFRILNNSNYVICRSYNFFFRSKFHIYHRKKSFKYLHILYLSRVILLIFILSHTVNNLDFLIYSLTKACSQYARPNPTCYLEWFSFSNCLSYGVLLLLPIKWLDGDASPFAIQSSMSSKESK